MDRKLGGKAEFFFFNQSPTDTAIAQVWNSRSWRPRFSD
jgi:hypothetical protein